jgi:glycosyltransferase involved in cell wall biosynthesis
MSEKQSTLQDSSVVLTSQLRKPSREHELNRRPKLLFLAYCFPPATASASVRTWNMAKHLARLGWDITVVMPHPSLWQRVENPEATDLALKREGINCIFTDHHWRCLTPKSLKCWNRGIGWVTGGICRTIARRLGINRAIGWVQPAEHACKTLASGDVDIILATGTPFASFALAKLLSERFGCPYVLDYRDPWTGNPHASRPAQPATIRAEARLLAGCAAVTIVSPSWASAMDSRFGLGPKLHVITNGYDPEELVGIEPYHFDHFAIVYAGSFYPPKRVISPVMAALRRLKETLNGNDPEWFFHYYGAHEDHVRNEARRFGVIDRVVPHGRVARSKVLSATRGAGAAVVITSITEEHALEDQGIVPGKIFEILGLGTLILLVAPPGGDVETILATTKLGSRFAGSDIGGMASFLMDAIHGQASKPKAQEAFAWTSIASRLDAVLRKAINSV